MGGYLFVLIVWVGIGLVDPTQHVCLLGSQPTRIARNDHNYPFQDTMGQCMSGEDTFVSIEVKSVTSVANETELVTVVSKSKSSTKEEASSSLSSSSSSAAFNFQSIFFSSQSDFDTKMPILLADDVLYTDPHGEEHNGKASAIGHMNKMRGKLSTLTGMPNPKFDEELSPSVSVARFNKLIMSIVLQDTIELNAAGLICKIKREKL